MLFIDLHPTNPRLHAVFKHSWHPLMHSNQGMAGRFSAIQPTMIERQRELEQKEDMLRSEFEAIDVNRDGRVTL